jgi:hypothetical protein
MIPLAAVLLLPCRRQHLLQSPSASGGNHEQEGVSSGKEAVKFSLFLCVHVSVLSTRTVNHRRPLVSGKSVSEFGKKRSEDDMTSIALIEAKSFADALMDHEFKGRGDKEKSVRFRLAKRCGVPESYLYRLQYKTRDMKDVAGEVYRRLRMEYEAMCIANEEAAARLRADRLAMRGDHETTGKEPVTKTD